MGCVICIVENSLTKTRQLEAAEHSLQAGLHGLVRLAPGSFTAATTKSSSISTSGLSPPRPTTAAGSMRSLRSCFLPLMVASPPRRRSFPRPRLGELALNLFLHLVGLRKHFADFGAG